MGIRSESGVYKILEDFLKKKGDEPQTCKDVFEKAKGIREFAESANRVSDFLGHMWRRGLLQRWHAPKTSTSLSRFAYTWKEDVEQDPVPVAAPPQLRAFSTKTGKPNCTITEEDNCVVLDFELFTITVQRKL